MLNKDVITVEVIVRYNDEDVRCRHSYSKQESEDFGLIPRRRPHPDDVMATYRWTEQMDRRRDIIDRMGQMIAHDVQRYIEDIEDKL